MTTQNIQIGQNVILNRNNRQFIAQVDAIFANERGLIEELGLKLLYIPSIGIHRQENGNLYSITVASICDVSENKTNMSISI